MIIRKDPNGTWIIAQPDHAWASGMIASRLDPRFYSPVERRLMSGIVSHHDDGWVEWEMAPRLAASGVPLNFTDLESTDHEAIWSRGIDRMLESLGPFAAAVLARHAQSIVQDGDAEFAHSLAQRIAALLRESAPGDDPVVRDWNLERAYGVLRLCDLLTLAPCAGWTQELTTPLLDPDGRTVEIAMKGSGPWEWVMGPWVFDVPSVSIGVPTVPVVGGDWTRALAAMATGSREMVELVIRPA